MVTKSAFNKAVAQVRAFLKREMARANRNLKDGRWNVILVGISDSGELSVHPCRLLLPFHYPKDIAELDAEQPSHFELAESILKNPDWRPEETKNTDNQDMDMLNRLLGKHAYASYRNAPRMWSVRCEIIPLFAKLYEGTATKHGLDFEKASDHKKELQLKVMRQACAGFTAEKTIIGIESDSEEWWEVLTFHLHGPLIPSPPPPVSDVQLLCRLRRHTHNYIGSSAFTIKRGRIIQLNLDGGCTTDASIDLLRDMPNLGSLLAGLKLISLQSTKITKKSLRFLKTELPRTKILWSPYS